jgi:hypothetical protein
VRAKQEAAVLDLESTLEGESQVAGLAAPGATYYRWASGIQAAPKGTPVTTPVRPKWIERFKELHPLLEAPPPLSDWAAREAEFDAASKADAEAARRARDEVARERERRYDNDTMTWVGIVLLLAIAALGLFVTFRLVEGSRIEDCLLAHHHNCESLRVSP